MSGRARPTWARRASTRRCLSPPWPPSPSRPCLRARPRSVRCPSLRLRRPAALRRACSRTRSLRDGGLPQMRECRAVQSEQAGRTSLSQEEICTSLSVAFRRRTRSPARPWIRCLPGSLQPGCLAPTSIGSAATPAPGWARPARWSRCRRRRIIWPPPERLVRPCPAARSTRRCLAWRRSPGASLAPAAPQSAGSCARRRGGTPCLRGRRPHLLERQVPSLRRGLAPPQVSVQIHLGQEGPALPPLPLPRRRRIGPAPALRWSRCPTRVAAGSIQPRRTWTWSTTSPLRAMPA